MSAAPHFRLEKVWLGRRTISPRKMIAWSTLALGILLAALVPGGSHVGGPLMAVAGMVLLLFYACSWLNIWSPPAPSTTGAVSVDDEHLTIVGDDGTTMSLPLAKLNVRKAWQEQRGHVALFQTGAADAITVTADDPGAIQALLRASGERVLLEKMRLSSWMQGSTSRGAAVGCSVIALLCFANFAGVLAVMLMHASLVTGVAAVLVSLLLIGGLVFAADRGAAEPELLAGSDGLLLRGAVVRRTIRYKDLGWARLDKRGIRLGKRNGSEEVLGMWRPGMPDLPDDPGADANARRTGVAGDIQHKRARVLARIQSGIAAGSALGDAQLALLDRGDQEVDAWRSAMDALLAHNEGTYRNARLDPHALATVLESPSQPLARRIGATLALRHVEDPELQERVRFAVESCIDDRLRVALERATQGEVAAESLAELEIEAAAPSQHGGSARKMRAT